MKKYLKPAIEMMETETQPLLEASVIIIDNTIEIAPSEAETREMEEMLMNFE